MSRPQNNEFIEQILDTGNFAIHDILLRNNN